MSLILEALKKLEREQARAAAPIITAGEAPWRDGRRAVPVWLLAIGALALVALGGLGTTFLTSRNSVPPARQAAAPPPAAAQPPVVAAPVVAPAEPPPVAPSTFRTAAPAAANVPESPREVQPRSAAPAVRPEPLPQRTAEAAAPADSGSGAANEPRASGPGSMKGEPHLQAISSRDGKPIALIDDRIFFEGDEIGDVKVLRIGTGEVEIEWRKQRHTLRF